MKKLFLLIGVIISLAIGGCTKIEEKPPQKQLNAEDRADPPDVEEIEMSWKSLAYEEALTTAQAENKRVILDFYTDTCSWCKKLDKNTFTDENVIHFLSENFVCLKINSREGQGIELNKDFSISGHPTIVFLESDGVEIDRITGYAPPDKFLSIARDYHAGTNTTADFLKRLEAHPDSLHFYFTLGKKYLERSAFESASEYLNKLVASDTENLSGKKDHAELLLAEMSYRQKEYDKGIEKLTEFVRGDRPEKLLKEGFSYLSRCYEAVEKYEESADTYREAIKRIPENAGLLNGFAWLLAEQDFALEEALEAAKKANELDPENTNILDTLAEVYYKCLEYESAIETIQKALKIKPDDSYLKEQLLKFKLATQDAQPTGDV
ncbi:MAG: hypothetical protein B6244_12350 [Candidatus Cloacimonetes bacterium 4572_55]|nr:MAG: hypothetical protein B6244_12350 [Candidatus Cloacimonetes bacterium 4572_55]